MQRNTPGEQKSIRVLFGPFGKEFWNISFSSRRTDVCLQFREYCSLRKKIKNKIKIERAKRNTKIKQANKLEATTTPPAESLRGMFT